MIAVAPCCGWINYHLVQKLLNGGNNIAGIGFPKTEKEELLYDFFGRNDHFHGFTSMEEAEENNGSAITTLIVVGCSSQIDEGKIQPVDRNIFIKVDDGDWHSERWSIIDVPLLFGEWMPRDETGIYFRNKHIPFDTAEFKENAIYIGDFAEVVAGLLEGETSWRRKRAIPDSSLEEGDNENIIKMKAKKTIEARLKELDEHYRNYQELY
ncbi:hypothetical protein [Sediminibacillus massiliensis]|uniref:hypothetical protein n=1 Tax=Sediminibacillus massiliensis TaxID=1926277 RepID=UPI0009885C7E|nr:hypothetical protein [Sediminibacillus massiliensis]